MIVGDHLLIVFLWINFLQFQEFRHLRVRQIDHTADPAESIEPMVEATGAVVPTDAVFQDALHPFRSLEPDPETQPPVGTPT